MNNRLSHRQEKYLQAAEALHYATREHFLLWFTGKNDRHGPTEKTLASLVKKGVLKSFRSGRPYIYCTPDRFTPPFDKLHHGLVCADALIAFLLADPTASVLSEKWLQGQKWGKYPEWGLVYSQSVLMLEFCTQDNISRGQVQAKANFYAAARPALRASLAREPVILFLLESDISKAGGYSQSYPGFYFVDIATFLSIPIKQHLTAPVYFWGGKGYPLRHG